jgi:E3 ubiquitin-protein ligase TRIP12
LRKRIAVELPKAAPVAKKRKLLEKTEQNRKASKNTKLSSETSKEQVEVMDTDDSKPLRGSASIPIGVGGKKSERRAADDGEAVVKEEEEKRDEGLFGEPEEDDEEDVDAQEGLFGEDEPGGLLNSTRRLADLVMGADEPRAFNPMVGGGGRWKEYVTGLQSGDEMVQLDSLINLADELCVMTEETANGFKLDQFIPSLAGMLNTSDNPNMVLLACRCMSHILEALPGSENAFVRHDAIPGLVEKLLNIEYDDLRDQAMNVLSRLCQNPISASSVLKNGGLCAILANLDFSAINTQVTAVTCAANMLRAIPPDTWPQIRDALPTLAMLLQYDDGRLVEKATISLASICTHYLSDASKLESIVNSGALLNLVRLITERTESSVEVSNLTWMVIRCLATLCRGLPGTAETLIVTGIPGILKTLLLMERENATKGIRQSAKTNTQAVYDMVALADQLLPPLPSDVAGYLRSAPTQLTYTGRRGILNSAPTQEIDLLASGSIPPPSDASHVDARALLYQKQPNTLLQVSECLLGTMTLVFGSRVNPQLRAKCLSTIAKIVFSCTPEMLTSLLKDLTFSSFLASLLASKELKFIAIGISIAENLMNKLPAIFSAYFTREGVVHEVEQLIACELNFKSNPSASNRTSTPSTPSGPAPGTSFPSTPNDASFIVPITPTTAPSFMWEALASPPNPSTLKARLGDSGKGRTMVLDPNVSTSPSSTSKPISFGDSPPKTSTTSIEFGSSSPGLKFGSSAPSTTGSGTGMETSENKLVSSSSASSEAAMDVTPSSESAPPAPNSMELLRVEVLAKCVAFKQKYFALDGTSSEGLDQLSTLASSLTTCLWNEKDAEKLKQTLETVAAIFEDGISTHEFVHSALPSALFQFLTLADSESHFPRHDRLVMFIHTFGKTSPSKSSPTASQNTSTTASSAEPRYQTLSSPWIQLVRELQNAIDKNENFRVKFNSALTPSGGLRAGSIVDFLTKAFTVKLLRDPSETHLPVIPEGPVAVEPLASGRSVKDFIWNHINTAIAQESAKQAEAARKAKEAKDTTPVASRTRSKLGELSPKASSSTNAMDVDSPSTTKRGKKDRKTPNKSDSSSSLTASSSSEKKSKSPTNGKKSAASTPKQEENPEKPNDPASEAASSSNSAASLSSSAASSSTTATSLMASSFSASSSSDALGTRQPLYGDIGDGEDDLEGIDEDGMAPGDGVYVQEVDASARPATPPLQRSPSSPSVAPSVGLSSFNLVILVNGTPLSDSASFFKVLKEKATETAYASESEISAPVAPLWSQTHTIHYRLYDPAIDGPALDPSASADKRKSGPFSNFGSMSFGPSSHAAPGIGNGASGVGEVLNDPEMVMRVDAAEASLERVLEQLMRGEVGATCGYDKTLVQLLSLLRVLESLNRDLTKLVPLAAAEAIVQVPAVEFVNAKLTAKLARQLQDPLSLITNTMPSWCSSLCSELPFLFPLDLRQLYFRGSALGIPRALLALKDRVEGALDGNFGRIKPHKVRVERDGIRHLNSALVVLQGLRSDPRSMLEVEYANEVATGAGPTLEFYTLVSHAFQQTQFQLWVPDGDAKVIKHEKPNSNEMQVDRPSTASISAATVSEGEVASEVSREKGDQQSHTSNEMVIVNNDGGLFPTPVLAPSSDEAAKEVIKMYSFLGTFIAKAIMDDRMIDMPFSVAFFKGLLGLPLQLDDLQPIYPQLVKTIRQFQEILDKKREIEASPLKDEATKAKEINELKFCGRPIEDMWLTFDLPGSNVELLPEGAQKAVTIHNLQEYVTLLVDAIAGRGVARQFEALQAGFGHIFEVSRLKVFESHELEMLICGSVEQDWSKAAILDAAHYTQGYSVNSRVSQWFATVLSEFDEEGRRKFLRFATGSPRLPPRGFKGFHHRLTLSRKDAAKNHKADDYYPSVSTCFLYIKIPDYSSFAIFKERFLTAIENGQQGFGLS